MMSGTTCCTPARTCGCARNAVCDVGNVQFAIKGYVHMFTWCG